MSAKKVKALHALYHAAKMAVHLGLTRAEFAKSASLAFSHMAKTRRKVKK